MAVSAEPLIDHSSYIAKRAKARGYVASEAEMNKTRVLTAVNAWVTVRRLGSPMVCANVLW